MNHKISLHIPTVNLHICNQTFLVISSDKFKKLVNLYCVIPITTHVHVPTSFVFTRIAPDVATSGAYKLGSRYVGAAHGTTPASADKRK